MLWRPAKCTSPPGSSDVLALPQVHSDQERSTLSFGILTSVFPIGEFNSATAWSSMLCIGIIWVRGSLLCSSSFLRIACINLLSQPEYMPQHHALFITVSSPGIFRRTWNRHSSETPVIEWMETQCSCELKFESNFRIQLQCASPHCVSSYTDGTHQNPKTQCTVGELAATWWFRSGC